jgi:hypothetical protein
MNLKLNFQISTPINLDMADQIISLVDIKPHFMTKDFKLLISALSETERMHKYDQVSFDLSNDNLKKGNCSLDFNEATAVFTIDAIFIIKPKSKYQSLVKNPDTKWAFGGIYISKNISSFEHDLSLDCNVVKSVLYNAKVIYGGSIEEFSYERQEKLFQSKYHILNAKVS